MDKMGRFDYYSNISSDTAKELMKIAKEINGEQESPTPDVEKIQKLTYRQLMTGLSMSVGHGRNYNIF
jgi:hypothetical protein